MPVNPRTPTAQALDSGGDLMGGEVAVELGGGGTSTANSPVEGVPSSEVV
jgi:hypothetical protein